MKFSRLYISALIAVTLVLAAGASLAQELRSGGRTYAVTITNLTKGQIFSPPIVYSHSGGFTLFELGFPASEELIPLAEGGDTGPLAQLLASERVVFDVITAGGPIPPGQSITLEVRARGRFRFIGVASMLVTTNDAFFALQRYPLPLRGVRQTTVPAYDAGSEVNSEQCESIPGPPCGGDARDDDGAEGYVYIHSGIHGIGDARVTPAEHGWHNPVAAISVMPL